MKNNLFANVFGWLFIGLLVTFGCSMLVLSSPALITTIFSGSLYMIIFIVQIVLAIYLGARINKMSNMTAKIIYLLYAGLTGITFSSIFIIFKISSIIFIFLVSAIVFGIFALIGKMTKIDLSKFGVFLIMSLFIIIILQIINMFILNGTLNMVASILATLIFMGYIAYDVQKLKQASEYGGISDNYAILFALDLYLDFINVFINLLNLFGDRK